MNRLIALLIIALHPIVAPSIGFADKTFADGSGAAVDCAKDPVVSIMANSGKYTFTGSCKSITVNGNSNKLTIDATDELSVNGNKNSVTANTAGAISTTGNDNKVSYKKGTPKISNLGSRNAITGK